MEKNIRDLEFLFILIGESLLFQHAEYVSDNEFLKADVSAFGLEIVESLLLINLTPPTDYCVLCSLFECSTVHLCPSTSDVPHAIISWSFGS